MSLLDLCARLEGLSRAGTPGPWEHGGGSVDYISPGRYSPCVASYVEDTDAALIAESRNALPALLSVARAAADWERAEVKFAMLRRKLPVPEDACDELVRAEAALRAAVRAAGDATKGGQ